jgi:hypothetical protein
MYRYVRTSMYRYVPVHTILPDPVQVYRIPDAVTSQVNGNHDVSMPLIFKLSSS